MWRSFSHFSVNSFMWYAHINLQCIVPCSSLWTLDVTLFGESLYLLYLSYFVLSNPSIFILYQISSLFNVAKWVWRRKHHSVLCSITNEIWLRGDTTVIHSFQGLLVPSVNYIKSMTDWRLEFNTSGYEGQWITLWCSYSLHDFAKHINDSLKVFVAVVDLLYKTCWILSVVWSIFDTWGFWELGLLLLSGYHYTDRFVFFVLLLFWCKWC